jgi:endonuclease G
MSEPLPRLKDLVPLADLAHADSPRPAGEEEGAQRFHDAEHFEGRKGYQPGFLKTFEVPLPRLSAAQREDAAPLLDGSGHLLHYQNFSALISKSRRMARYVAVNIHGKHSDRDRLCRARDRWFYDGRIDPAFQLGEDLYADCELDRGHLVRREDPVWGDCAQQANDDTFHFTNCAPQHAGFNQRVWLGLEKYILDNARVHGLNACVFTGPVFKRDDPEFRGVQLPRSFWKVVSIFSEKRRSVTAYQVSQAQLLEDLEFLYGQYQTFQVSVRAVEKLTGLDFGPLRPLDGFSNEETATGCELRLPVADWGAIRV